MIISFNIDFVYKFQGLHPNTSSINIFKESSIIVLCDWFILYDEWEVWCINEKYNCTNVKECCVWKDGYVKVVVIVIHW